MPAFVGVYAVCSPPPTSADIEEIATIEPPAIEMLPQRGAVPTDAKSGCMG